MEPFAEDSKKENPIYEEAGPSQIVYDMATPGKARTIFGGVGMKDALYHLATPGKSAAATEPSCPESPLPSDVGQWNSFEENYDIRTIHKKDELSQSKRSISITFSDIDGESESDPMSPAPHTEVVEPSSGRRALSPDEELWPDILGVVPQSTTRVKTPNTNANASVPAVPSPLSDCGFNAYKSVQNSPLFAPSAKEDATPRSLRRSPSYTDAVAEFSGQSPVSEKPLPQTAKSWRDNLPDYLKNHDPNKLVGPQPVTLKIGIP